eukprot:481753-Rhodomonas_salina.2
MSVQNLERKLEEQRKELSLRDRARSPIDRQQNAPAGSRPRPLLLCSPPAPFGHCDFVDYFASIDHMRRCEKCDEWAFCSGGRMCSVSDVMFAAVSAVRHQLAAVPFRPYPPGCVRRSRFRP